MRTSITSGQSRGASRQATVALAALLTAGCQATTASNTTGGETGAPDAQSDTSTKGPVAFFPEDFHDLGEVEQGQKVSHVFKIQNRGTEPLVIEKVRGS